MVISPPNFPIRRPISGLINGGGSVENRARFYVETLKAIVSSIFSCAIQHKLKFHC